MQLRKGFTLVELAIVLVIIGLLIGGILAAQSMIETARMNSAIRQIQQFDIAVSNFKATFQGLPGDTDKFSLAGNNDGIINHVRGQGSGACGFFWGEDEFFWVHLQQGGFTYLGKHFSPSSLLPGRVFDTTSLAPESPSLRLDSNSGVIVESCDGIANTYIFGNWDGLELDSGDGDRIDDFKGVLKPVNALAIDAKIDDGLPGSGKVQDLNGLVGGFDAVNCSDGTSYSSNITTVSCGLSIILLSQVGQDAQ
jgi:prepilin-type N-terminal cleavage/methylation domain-containing protein